MNKSFLTLAAALGWLAAQGAVTNSVGYGVRVWSEATQSAQALVSFPLSDPSQMKEELSLDGYNIVAATAVGDDYYMLHSNDGFLVDKMLRLNLNTRKISVVKEYDWKDDLAGNIIYTDLTTDPTDGTIYAGGYNLDNSVTNGDEISAPYALLKLNPETGDATMVGEQDYVAFVALAIDADGYLYGINDQGGMWEISKYNGNPEYELDYLRIMPVGTQSMAYDATEGVFYWASFSYGLGGDGQSSLMKIAMTDYWELVTENLGPVGENNEIIGLYIDTDPVSAEAPSVVEDLEVAPASEGVAAATLTWKNPTATVGGGALQEFKLLVYRDDELVATLQGEGETQSYTDADVAAGMHTYSIAADNGVAMGRPVYAESVWIGADVPGVPRDAEAVKVEGGIEVSWKAPTEGLHDGWFEAESLTYTLVRTTDGKTLLENSTATSYLDNDIAEMHGYIYEITATTAAGVGGSALTGAVVAGKPYKVPYTADFNVDDQVNQWTSVDNDGDEYTWYAYKNGWGGTFDTFFRYNPESKLNPEEEVSDWLISPAVELEVGKLYVARYDVRLLGDLFPANTTLALGNGPSPAAMTKVLLRNDGEITDIEWTTDAAPFTVDADGVYYFGYEARNAVPVQFYKFSVIEVGLLDLSADAIVGDGSANVSSSNVYTVAVTNRGFETVGNYMVELVDVDGNVLASTEVVTPLPTQQTVNIDVEWIPEKDGKWEIYGRVVAEGDVDAANNITSPMSVNVLNADESIDVTSGTTLTGYAPLYGQYLHSAVQTIYTADMLGNHGEADIQAITYYIYSVMGSDYTFNFRVYLANTDKDCFTTEEMIGEDEFTEVYNAFVSINSQQKTMTINFDRPFHYAGGNLCVCTSHDADGLVSVFFDCDLIKDDETRYTCLYRGDEPFNFSQSPSGIYRDIPNVSFLTKPGDSGVEELLVPDGASRVVYSRGRSAIHIFGEYDLCRIYTTAGILLGEYSGVDEIPMESFGSGIVIVELATENGRRAVKVAL